MDILNKASLLVIPDIQVCVCVYARLIVRFFTAHEWDKNIRKMSDIVESPKNADVTSFNSIPMTRCSKGVHTNERC